MTEPPGKMAVAWAWVWFCLVILARFNLAQEPHWETDGAVAGSEELFSNCELPEETGIGTEFLPVPVWNITKVSDGEDLSDSGRPQFGCGEMNLCVRFRPVRHSELRLEDGRTVSALSDKCDVSVWTFGPWLFLKLPYSGCPVESWVSSGTSFHQLKLRYFDRLLQTHVTAVATCQDPAARLKLAAPLVRCRATDVTMKLPLGTSLKRVDALAEDFVLGTAFGTVTTPDALVVHISRAMDVDLYLEIMLLGSAGEISTLPAVCLTTSRRPVRHRRRRALKQPNPLGYWDIDLFPHHTYSPEGPECGGAGDESSTMTTPWCVDPSSTPWCVDPTSTTPSSDPTSTTPPSSDPTSTTTPSSDPTSTTPPSSDPTSTTPPSSDPTSTTPPSSDPTSTTPPSSDPTSTTTPSSDPTSTTTPSSDPTSTTTPSSDPTSTTTPSSDPTSTTPRKPRRKPGWKRGRKPRRKPVWKRGKKPSKKRGTKPGRRPGKKLSRKPAWKRGRKRGWKRGTKPGRKPGWKRSKKLSRKPAWKRGRKRGWKRGTKPWHKPKPVSVA